MSSKNESYEINDQQDENERQRLEEKRSAFASKWQQKLDDREQQKQIKLQQKESEKAPNEDVDKFNAFVKTQRNSISQAIDAAVSDNQQGSLSRDDMVSRLSDLSSQVQALQQEIAKATLFLPAYDIRQASEVVSQLTAQVDKARTTSAPRKKFAFRKTKSKKTPGTKATAPVTTNASDTRSVQASLASLGIETNSEVIYDSAHLDEGGNELVILPGELKRDEFVRFTGLEGCNIYLSTVVGSLRLVDLKNCNIYVGPINGSCFVENCTGCTIMVASRQVRIHHTYSTSFYLNVLSRPIIEDCNGLLFDGYALQYPLLDEQMKDTKLENGRTNMSWKDVDDFKWLRAQQSPNWAIMEPGQRAAEVVPGASEKFAKLEFSLVVQGDATAAAN